jgi:hypothetical protein
MRSFMAVLVTATLTGCASGAPLPAPPTGPVPDIVGTWRGTWGGHPAVLLVTDQSVDAGYSGVFAGNYQILGHRRPGVSGVLTSTIRGTAVSSRAEGWLGNDARGRLVLVVQTDTPDGQQRLTLARVSEDELQGTGESSFRWGPQGPARLTRQPR